MKLPATFALALAIAPVVPCLARENPAAVAPRAVGEALTGRINELQAAIVEGMRATEAADRERRMARLSTEINALQSALVQVLRERGSRD